MFHICSVVNSFTSIIKPTNIYFQMCSFLGCIGFFICAINANSLFEVNETEASVPITSQRNMGIFYSEQEIFDILMDEKNRDRRNVSDLIRVYQERCMFTNPTESPSTKPRRPFIVVESNYRPPRKAIAKQLADILNGKYVSIPPSCLRDFSYSFEYSAELRRAFFGLSIYAAAHEVRVHYQNHPVIASGYWADQTSFAIAKVFDMEKIPDVGDKIYNWPKDLMKPDVSFLVNVPQQTLGPDATTPFPDNFQKKRIKAFRNMRKPRLREIKDIHYYDTILAQMQSRMLTIFMHPRWKNKNVRY